MSATPLQNPAPASTLSWRFWVFWASQAVSNLADGFFRVALPLLAVQLTRDPLLVSGVAFALSLPWLLLSLPVGVFVDRWDRRRTMAIANGVRVLVLSLAVYLLVVGEMNIFVLYAVAFGLGVAETVTDTAAGALLPALVPTAKLEQANARLVGVQTVTNQFLGPPLGSALVTLGVVYAFGWSGLLYLAAFFFLLPIRGLFTAKRQAFRPLYDALRDGLDFIRASPPLRVVITIIAALNLCWSAYYALLVLYAVQPGPLGLSPFQYGLILTSVGVGGTLGAYLVDFVQRHRERQWLLFGDILGLLVLLVVSLLTANFYVFLIAGTIAGIAGSISNVALVSLRQRIVPDEFLGRVGGASRLFSYGALSLGAAGAGLVAQYVGVRGVFGICIVIVLLVMILCLKRLPSLAQLYAKTP